jgi:hypothetical protein
MYIHVHNGISSIKFRPRDLDNKPVNFDYFYYYKMIVFGLAELVGLPSEAENFSPYCHSQTGPDTHPVSGVLGHFSGGTTIYE